MNRFLILATVIKLLCDAIASRSIKTRNCAKNGSAILLSRRTQAYCFCDESNMDSHWRSSSSTLTYEKDAWLELLCCLQCRSAYRVCPPATKTGKHFSLLVSILITSPPSVYSQPVVVRKFQVSHPRRKTHGDVTKEVRLRYIFLLFETFRQRWKMACHKRVDQDIARLLIHEADKGNIKSCLHPPGHKQSHLAQI